MKIKNIAFSGFAAAILAGVSATDASAAINLVTQEYVTAEMGKKQNTLTADNAGEGIKIENGVISAEVDLSSTIGELTNENGETITVAEALAEKQDKLTESESAALETIAGSENLETVLNSGVSADTVQQVTTNATNITNLTETVEGKADKATTLEGYGITDAYTKDETDGLLNAKQDSFELGANLQWDEDGKLNTKGIATAEGLEELESKVAEAVTETELEGMGYQNASQVETTVNTAITNLDLANTYESKGAAAQALLDAQAYADANDADTIYDDAEVRGLISANAENIATNTADIAKINAANYISGDGAAGSYLITKDGNGGVVWSAINVIDENGNVMSLTSQAE